MIYLYNIIKCDNASKCIVIFTQMGRDKWSRGERWVYQRSLGNLFLRWKLSRDPLGKKPTTRKRVAKQCCHDVPRKDKYLYANSDAQVPSTNVSLFLLSNSESLWTKTTDLMQRSDFILTKCKRKYFYIEKILIVGKRKAEHAINICLKKILY